MKEYYWHTDIRYFNVAELFEELLPGNERSPFSKGELRKAEAMALELDPAYTFLVTRTGVKNPANKSVVAGEKSSALIRITRETVDRVVQFGMVVDPEGIGVFMGRANDKHFDFTQRHLSPALLDTIPQLRWNSDVKAGPHGALRATGTIYSGEAQVYTFSASRLPSMTSELAFVVRDHFTKYR